MDHLSNISLHNVFLQLDALLQQRVDAAARHPLCKYVVSGKLLHNFIVGRKEDALPLVAKTVAFAVKAYKPNDIGMLQLRVRNGLGLG